jgi:cell wall-associated NlpC family hydrolase
MVFVFRYGSKIDSDRLLQVAASLLDKTVYTKPSKLEEAPEKADCLTVIHYLYKKALKVTIPLTFIGDMPRRLASYGEWRPLCIKQEDAQCGDLLFVKNKSNTRLITHIAMFIDARSIFHCCLNEKTAVIQRYETFASRYTQSLGFRIAVRYIDHRNQRERDQQGGPFIKD